MARTVKKRRLNDDGPKEGRIALINEEVPAAVPIFKVPEDVDSDESDADAIQDAYATFLTRFKPKSKAEQKDAVTKFASPMEHATTPVTNGEDQLDGEQIGIIAAASDEDVGEDAFDAHFAQEARGLSDRIAQVALGEWGEEKRHLPLGRTVQHSVKSNIKDEQRPRFKKRLQNTHFQLSKRDPHLAQLASFIYKYQDILYCGRTVHNANLLRSVACLHALNHILKTRDRIIKNTARLAREDGAVLELRDQGFTRPKVLVLLETRQTCVKYLDSMAGMLAPVEVENRKRFQAAFSRAEDGLSEGYPQDFKDLFQGNDDNDFRIGIKFTRKTIKLFSQFYSSDIIFASPLGLRRLVQESTKQGGYDSLSSIELVIIDQVDAMLMQNWEHVEQCLSHLNLQPRESHGCDFGRVRQWYLDGNSRYLRQTIVFSAYLTPELNSLYVQLKNVGGKTRILPLYNGVISNVHQMFYRFSSESVETEPDARFDFFCNSIMPSLLREVPKGLGALIFIPSYYDFVRVRNFFSTSDAVKSLTYGSISEYTDQSKADRARSHFVAGRQSVMLYTGRAHHFHRYRLRGVRRLVMYGLPANPLFYSELVDFLEDTETIVQILFSKWDGLALERVVGTSRVGRMLSEFNDTFEFS